MDDKRGRGEGKGGGCWANKFSHCFLCAICRQRGGAMAAKEAVEEGKEGRIGEGRERAGRKIHRGVRKLTAREISTYTHITYIHIKCTFKFILNATLSFQNGLTGKATLKKKKSFRCHSTLRRSLKNGVDLKNQNNGYEKFG